MIPSLSKISQINSLGKPCRGFIYFYYLKALTIESAIINGEIIGESSLKTCFFHLHGTTIAIAYSFAKIVLRFTLLMPLWNLLAKKILKRMISTDIPEGIDLH